MKACVGVVSCLLPAIPASSGWPAAHRAARAGAGRDHPSAFFRGARLRPAWVSLAGRYGAVGSRATAGRPAWAGPGGRQAGYLDRRCQHARHGCRGAAGGRAGGLPGLRGRASRRAERADRQHPLGEPARGSGSPASTCWCCCPSRLIRSSVLVGVRMFSSTSVARSPRPRRGQWRWLSCGCLPTVCSGTSGPRLARGRSGRVDARRPGAGDRARPWPARLSA